MRRKSERNKPKPAEKKAAEPSPKKSRRSSRRRKRSTSRSSSEDSDDAPLKIAPEIVKPEVIPPEEPKKTSSHSNSEEDKDEQPIWKVKTSDASSGEIQKLKICLQRPSTTPERTEKSPRRRRGKTSSQSDEASLTPDEKMHKRKCRNSPCLNTSEGSSLDNSAIEAAEKDECLTIIKETNEVIIGKGKLDSSQTKQDSENEKYVQDSQIDENQKESHNEFDKKDDTVQSKSNQPAHKKEENILKKTQINEESSNKQIEKNKEEEIKDKNINNPEPEACQSEEKIIKTDCSEEKVAKEIEIDSNSTKENVEDCTKQDMQPMVQDSKTEKTDNSSVTEATNKCYELDSTVLNYSALSEETNTSFDAKDNTVLEKTINESIEDKTTKDITEDKESSEHCEISVEKLETPKESNVSNETSEKPALMHEQSSEVQEKSVKKSKDSSEVQEKTTKNTENQEDSNKKMEESTTKLGELKDNLEKSDEKLKESSATAEESKEKLNELSEKPKESTEELEESKEKIQESTKKLEESKEKIQDETKKLEESKEKIQESTKKLEESKEKIQESTEKSEESKENVQESIEKSDESKDKIEASNKKVQESTEKLEDSKENIESSTKKVQESTEKLEESKENIESSNKKVQESTEKLEELKEKIEVKDKVTQVSSKKIVKSTEKLEESKEIPENVAESEKSCDKDLAVTNNDEIESQSNTPEPEPEPNKKSNENADIIQIEDESCERFVRKRKWGKYKVSATNEERITLNSIASFCPLLKMLTVKELKLDKPDTKDVEQKLSKRDRNKSKEIKERDIMQMPSSPKQHEDDSEKEVSNIGLNRKISIVNDEASKLQPPPSPANHPVSAILFITNLVRPFTLKQLQELLSRTGKIVEDGFWTDKIKSKCYVEYETEEEAESTRNALHGVQWPTGNGKKLVIDFATVESMKAAQNVNIEVPVVATTTPEKVSENVAENAKKETAPNEQRWDNQRTTAPIREWDLGKVPQDFRDRSRSRDRTDSRMDRADKRRPNRNESPSNGDNLTSRKKRKEEQPEVKLMDDLFHKTKATPSIYWLPLSPEQIAKKQQQRLQRMAEHKRRMEESRRFDRDRDFGRGGQRARRRSARYDGGGGGGGVVGGGGGGD